MLIKYLGPSLSVNVGNFGVHRKGEAKEYPDAIGKELLETAKKQRFAAATSEPKKAATVMKPKFGKKK